MVNNVIKTRQELGYKGMPYLDASVNFMQYSNGVMVYDVLNDKFFWTDPLPINNNYPLVVIADDDIYIIGGETGGGCVLGKPTGRHSDLVLKQDYIEVWDIKIIKKIIMLTFVSIQFFF